MEIQYPSNFIRKPLTMSADTKFQPSPYLLNGFWAIGFGSTFYEDGQCVQSWDPAISVEKATELLAFCEKYRSGGKTYQRTVP